MIEKHLIEKYDPGAAQIRKKIFHSICTISRLHLEGDAIAVLTALEINELAFSYCISRTCKREMLSSPASNALLIDTMKC